MFSKMPDTPAFSKVLDTPVFSKAQDIPVLRKALDITVFSKALDIPALSDGFMHRIIRHHAQDHFAHVLECQVHVKPSQKTCIKLEKPHRIVSGRSHPLWSNDPSNGGEAP